MAGVHRLIFPYILNHQATETVINLQPSAQNAKRQTVLEVVPEGFGGLKATDVDNSQKP